MENTKQPYELSLWDDIVIPAAGGNPEHFEETKVAIIGASNMDTPIRAYNVSLKENINGERTLTFQINYKYYENGELKDNPFLNLLKNERKLKLRVGAPYASSSIEDLEAEDTEEKWVDFIIKDSDKDSNNKSITFIAKEVYVNELGKNGWSILLSTELENNYGTINELGGYILEGSDWVVGQGYSPTEKAVEPLFRTTLSGGITAKNTLTGVNKVIASGQYIYPLYSSVEWNEATSQWKLKSGEIQFLWAGRLLTVDDANDDRVIIDEESTYNCVYSGAITTGTILMTGSPTGGEALNGNKIVKTQNSRYESILGKYVKDFETLGAVGGTPAVPTGSTVFGYPETEYITSSIVQNYLTNASNVTSALAWSPDNRAYAKLLPEPTGDPSTWLAQNPINYLAIPFTSNNQRVENEGPENSRLALNKDSIYVVRMKARWIRKAATNYGTNGSNILTSSLPAITVGIRTDSKVFTNSASITLTSNINASTANMDTRGYADPIANKQSRPRYTGSLTALNRDEQGYVYVFLKATDSSRASTEKLRFFINNTASSATHDLHIEDVQLFDYKEDNDGTNVFPVFPGDIPTARVETKDRFYWINGAGEVEYLSSDKALYAPIYRDQYESVRSIEVKESNYFNNIQSLAELFEVWAKFKVYHRKNGKLLLVDNLPKKEVIFSKYSPNGDQVNYTGFKYGINLKGIKRNLESNSLSTKVIVKNNNQQFAVDGMASISRAHDNPSGENEIYNFNYFVNQGLLDYSQVLADLYGMTSTDMAVLTKLKKLNVQYIDKAKLLQSYENEIAIAKSYVTLYEAEVASATEEESYLNYIYSQLATGDPKKEATKVSLAQVKAKEKTYTAAMNAYKTRQTTYEGFRDSAQDDIDDILIEKKLLKLSFYKKYSRFIQEGTWTDDKYIDDDLYYLDASKVASVAAFPKLSYTIDVIDVEGAQGFEGYKFRIGERTYVEDPEFFGYVIKSTPVGTVKTPYKQEVIVSERTRNLDDPSKSSLTIKSYKSQPEELFQKINASANQLQYEGGGYQRAAAAISPLGEIDQTALAQSFANNAFVISSAQNQNVIWDTGQGIEIINNDNSSERMRIVAGGIFLSTDGGRNWTNGMSGMGINTRYLLAGQIDASKINIVQGTTQYFRWDTAGISAFYVDEDNGTYDITRFVRFNQFGLFGTNNGLDLELAVENAATYDEKLAAVQECSTFSLTWDGLLIQYQEGAVSLNPINGLEIFGQDLFGADILSSYDRIIGPSGELYIVGDKIPRVSLGRYYENIGDTDPKYGLRLRNRAGYVSLSTDDDGNLWLSDLLSVGGLTTYDVTDNVITNTLLTRSANLTFSISGVTLPKKGVLGIQDTESSYSYTEANYTYNGGVYSFTIPANALDSDGFTVTTGTYPLSYPEVTDQSYRYLGINGMIAEQTSDPIILYAGHYEADLAPFQVSASGILRARNAELEGMIYALGGEFSGEILVGDYSGIIGSIDADYTLWTGFARNITKSVYVTYVPPGTEDARATFTLSGVPTDLFFRGVIQNRTNGMALEFTMDDFVISGNTYQFNVLASGLGITQSGTRKFSFSSRTPNFYVTPNGKLFAQNVEIYGMGVFSGTIYATDGSFSGTVNAESGSITGQLFFGSGTNSYIGYVDETSAIISVENGRFEVDAHGNVFASAIYLSHNNIWNLLEPTDKTKTYNILVGDGSSGNYVIQIFDPRSQDVAQKDTVFAVRNDGSILIDGTLTTTKDLVFNGVIKASNISINGLLGEITSRTPNLDGWGIFEDGSAVFQNVDIRGKISSAVFEYNSISSVGGTLLVSPSVMLMTEVPLVAGKFDISSQVSNNLQVWGEVDNITINLITSEGKFTYTGVSIADAKITPSVEMAGITALPVGTQIISTSTKTNSILLSAEEVYGPTISMIGATESAGVTSVVVIGNLSSHSVPSTVFSSISGYGLYADNAYLTGQLYLPNAGVTNEETLYEPDMAHEVFEDDRRIRFWAGASSENKHLAPFAVTQDGRLYATDGVFKGRIEAKNSTFSGDLEVAGILINDDEESSSYKHFYVTSPYSEEPSPETYILNIDRNGLNIWEGGLQIYSDYYGGWRIGDTTTPSGPINPYYGYEAGENENPYPIFKVRDISDSANLVPRISQVHTHFWFKQPNIAYSTRVSPGLIDFGSYPITLQTSSDYAVLEDLIYNSADRKLLIGLISAADQKYGLKTNSTISISGDFTDAFRFTPDYSFDEEENMINTSVSQVEGIFKFGEVVQITQEPDGLVFTYIGTDE